MDNDPADPVVRFVPQRTQGLLPSSFVWQGALLGGFAGGVLDVAPRLRELLPQHESAVRLVVEDVNDILALLSGQSRYTELAGRDAGLWWRHLPLGRITLKKGRAVAGFR